VQKFRSHRNALSWVAVFALVVAALLPSLARALADDGKVFWTEVCSAQGMRFVAVSDSGVVTEVGQPPASNGSMDHCPYCKLLDPVALVEPPAISRAQRAPNRDRMPALFWHGARGLYAWSSAQPRAPPPSV
jgi:hypothetical protein